MSVDKENQIMAEKSRKERIPITADDSPLSVSLGALLGRETPRPSPAPPPPAQEKKERDEARLPPRAVLSRETKGRGGKTVTVISFRGGAPFDMEPLAKEIRTALGCGGSVEGEQIILQGNQVERASDWLADRGVKTVKDN